MLLLYARRVGTQRPGAFCPAEVGAGLPVTRPDRQAAGRTEEATNLKPDLAEGASMEEILADFPTVSREAMRAVVAFAAASAGEDLPVPFAPATA